MDLEPLLKIKRPNNSAATTTNKQNMYSGPWREMFNLLEFLLELHCNASIIMVVWT
jgi:hypothetical protein